MEQAYTRLLQIKQRPDLFNMTYYREINDGIDPPPSVAKPTNNKLPNQLKGKEVSSNNGVDQPPRNITKKNP